MRNWKPRDEVNSSRSGISSQDSQNAGRNIKIISEGQKPKLFPIRLQYDALWNKENRKTYPESS
jgi:hypothetical protein